MKKQIKSFRFAFEGIGSAIKNEAHLRFHLVAAFYVFVFAFLGNFTPLQWAVLSITVFLVISAELINTVIEELCDLYSKERNAKIKYIKDISAGAVLMLAAGSCIVAVSLFLLTGNLARAFSTLISNPLLFIPLGISALICICFVVFFGKSTKKTK